MLPAPRARCSRRRRGVCSSSWVTGLEGGAARAPQHSCQIIADGRQATGVRRASDIIGRFPRAASEAPLPFETLSPDPPLRPSLSGRVRDRHRRHAAGRVDGRDAAARSSSRSSTTSAPSTPIRYGGCPSRSSACSCCAASARTRASTGSRGSARASSTTCAARRAITCSAADAVLRRDVGGLPAVPDHVRRAADRRDGLRSDHRQHSQHADDRLHARLPAVSQLAAHADRARRRSRSSPSRCARCGGG